MGYINNPAMAETLTSLAGPGWFAACKEPNGTLHIEDRAPKNQPVTSQNMF
jgi:hypothetical protein